MFQKDLTIEAFRFKLHKEFVRYALEDWNKRQSVTPSVSSSIAPSTAPSILGSTFTLPSAVGMVTSHQSFAAQTFNLKRFTMLEFIEKAIAETCYTNSRLLLEAVPKRKRDVEIMSVLTTQIKIFQRKNLVDQQSLFIS